MKEKEIRLLKASEIECRIGTIKSNGLSLLLYKDARVDQRLLDEIFGPYGWKREHELINGNLFCTVSVRDEDTGEWISKQDVGTESYTEKEKGAASDSFKRACVNWGIGRELYSAPFIWIGSEYVDIKEKNGKKYTNEKFKVQDISYNEDRAISGLVIAKQNGAVVYTFGQLNKDEVVFQNANRQSEAIQKKETERTSVINRELDRTGIALDAVLERYNVRSINEMSDATYKNAVNSLKKTKNKAA